MLTSVLSGWCVSGLVENLFFFLFLTKIKVVTSQKHKHISWLCLQSRPSPTASRLFPAAYGTCTPDLPHTDCLKCAPCLLTPPRASRLLPRVGQHAHTRLPETFQSGSPFPNNVGRKKKKGRETFLSSNNQVDSAEAQILINEIQQATPGETGQGNLPLSRAGTRPLESVFLGCKINRFIFSRFPASSPATSLPGV